MTGLRAAIGGLTATLVVLLGAVPCAQAADSVGAPTVAAVGTVLYDSTGYTTEDNEDLQCGAGVTGGKSGWTRFDVASNGVLTITLASDYDALLHIYTTPTTASAPALGDLKDAACADDDQTPSGGVESRAISVQRGESIYVQTLGAGADPGSASGQNTLTLAFVPADGDGDRVPDSSDACPQVAGLQADGCPPAAMDTDQDGVPDAVDRCPTTSGDLANGCLSHLYGDIRGRWQTNRLLTKLVSLVVEAPVGSRIDLQCSGHKGVCPFTRVLIAQTSRPVMNLRSYFKKRIIFPNATSIAVRVTRPRQIGIYQHLVTRRNRKLPKVTRACIASNGKITPCS
ncbi:MAG TPA: thrombospondin type 3 repeat-containing protein [Solirubrobacteraceae bacterium]|jgi:hypothetical protein|nr:thrombospondin type 3 repeat-containing protein [Solirubrobacteraceae bacterium]